MNLQTIDREIEKLKRHEQIELIKMVLDRHQLEDLADRKRPSCVRGKNV